MPDMMDAAETFDLLQRWDRTSIESPDLVVALLDRLLLPPLDGRLFYQQPDTESWKLKAQVAPRDFAGAHSHSAMACGAFPHLLGKVLACARTPAGLPLIEAWAARVLTEPKDAARQGPASLRSLMVLHLMPEVVWDQSEVRGRLSFVLNYYPHLVDPLIQDPHRPITLRANLLMVMVGRSDGDHISFLKALGSPARGELMAHLPFRRFLWKRLVRTVEAGTFQYGMQLAVLNLLVETSDDRELTPLVDSALRSDPHVNSLVACSWARVLVALHAAGRLDALLPGELTFSQAYAARFPDDQAGRVPRYDRRGVMSHDEFVQRVVGVSEARRARGAALPQVPAPPRLKGGVPR